MRLNYAIRSDLSDICGEEENQGGMTQDQAQLRVEEVMKRRREQWEAKMDKKHGTGGKDCCTTRKSFAEAQDTTVHDWRMVMCSLTWRSHERWAPVNGRKC